MSSLLIDEHPLVVLPSLAKEIGLNEAIMLQQIHFWISKRKHLKDGRYWVYNTYDGWTEQFPFWSKSTTIRILKRLEDSELIITGNHNRLKIDNTKWYTINYEKVSELSKLNTPSSQIEQTD